MAGLLRNPGGIDAQGFRLAGESDKLIGIVQTVV
jgi:hypothetical protein